MQLLRNKHLIEAMKRPLHTLACLLLLLPTAAFADADAYRASLPGMAVSKTIRISVTIAPQIKHQVPTEAASCLSDALSSHAGRLRASMLDCPQLDQANDEIEYESLLSSSGQKVLVALPI